MFARERCALLLMRVQRFRPGACAVGCGDNSDKAHNEWLVLSRWSVRAPISAVVALFYSLSNQVKHKPKTLNSKPSTLNLHLKLNPSTPFPTRCLHRHVCMHEVPR